MRSAVAACLVVLGVVFAMNVRVAASDNGVHWISFEEAVKRSKTEPRKILIDVYTEWCGWCKKMDKATYEDPAVAAYINATYWPVKLDAERKDTVVFNEKAFVYVKERKAHALALSLLSEKMSYPTTVFLNEDFSMIQAVPGYLDARTMSPILAFFGEPSTADWETFKKNFTGLPTKNGK